MGRMSSLNNVMRVDILQYTTIALQTRHLDVGKTLCRGNMKYCHPDSHK